MSLGNTSASRVHFGSCGAGLIDFRPDEEQQTQYTITETYPSLTDMKRRLHVDKEKQDHELRSDFQGQVESFDWQGRWQ
jgi:hypothetical protein